MPRARAAKGVVDHAGLASRPKVEPQAKDCLTRTSGLGGLCIQWMKENAIRERQSLEPPGMDGLAPVPRASKRMSGVPTRHDVYRAFRGKAGKFESGNL